MSYTPQEQAEHRRLQELAKPGVMAGLQTSDPAKFRDTLADLLATASSTTGPNGQFGAFRLAVYAVAQACHDLGHDLARLECNSVQASQTVAAEAPSNTSDAKRLKKRASSSGQTNLWDHVLLCLWAKGDAVQEWAWMDIFRTLAHSVDHKDKARCMSLVQRSLCRVDLAPAAIQRAPFVFKHARGSLTYENAYVALMDDDIIDRFNEYAAQDSSAGTALRQCVSIIQALDKVGIHGPVSSEYQGEGVKEKRVVGDAAGTAMVWSSRRTAKGGGLKNLDKSLMFRAFCEVRGQSRVLNAVDHKQKTAIHHSLMKSSAVEFSKLADLGHPLTDIEGMSCLEHVIVLNSGGAQIVGEILRRKLYQPNELDKLIETQKRAQEFSFGAPVYSCAEGMPMVHAHKARMAIEAMLASPRSACGVSP